ncbi:hypothetical protein MTO96_027053 [Rhipicephalus appendiculatus]
MKEGEGGEGERLVITTTTTPVARVEVTAVGALEALEGVEVGGKLAGVLCRESHGMSRRALRGRRPRHMAEWEAPTRHYAAARRQRPLFAISLPSSSCGKAGAEKRLSAMHAAVT